MTDAEVLYQSICTEVPQLSVFDMLAMKKAYKEQLPLNSLPPNVQKALVRVAERVRGNR